jgi:hypothetical protein
MGVSTAINIAGMYVFPNLPTLSPLGFIQATLGEQKLMCSSLPGAIKLAMELGSGHTIVTILWDLGTRCHIKIFKAEFLKYKELPYPECLDAANHDTTNIPEDFEQVEWQPNLQSPFHKVHFRVHADYDSIEDRIPTSSCFFELFYHKEKLQSFAIYFQISSHVTILLGSVPGTILAIVKEEASTHGNRVTQLYTTCVL